MLKKIALITILLIIAGASAWHLYYRDGKLQPVSRDEGLKLLAQVEKGIEKNESGIKNGRGKITMSGYFSSSNRHMSEMKGTCDIVFSGDTYKVEMTDTFTDDAEPRRSIGERIKLFFKNLASPGKTKPSAKSTPRPASANTHTSHYIYYSNKKRLIMYDCDTNSAMINDIGPAGDEHNRIMDRQLRTYIMCRAAEDLKLEDDAPTAHPVNGKPGAIETLAPMVSGMQRIRGNDCIVIQQKSYGSPIILERQQDTLYTNIYWVCPRKGYSIIRSEVWGCSSRTQSSREMLLSRANIDVKEYKPGVWGLERHTFTVYALDDEKKLYKQQHFTIAYEPNFQLNIPANKINVNLKLPKGTRVNDEVRGKEYVVK